MFMEVENGSNNDLSEETGIFQPSVSLDLSNLTDTSNSTSLDFTKDISLLVVHDATMNINNAIANYFGTLEAGGNPRYKKVGMSIIPRRR
jgi:hypothetical protein